MPYDPEFVIGFNAPNPKQIAAMANVRTAAIEFSQAIIDNVPDCADRVVALREVREASMWACAAISLGGAFEQPAEHEYQKGAKS
jgi:hypothetical protein